MYAVVETGGKQYKVKSGDTLRVEKLEGDIGSEITLDKVLMAGEGGDVKTGAPYVDGATVTAKITEQHRTRKIIVFKYKRRKGYRVKRGHRQHYTALRIGEIKA
jgi:large subunit ribosomal protein L21